MISDSKKWHFINYIMISGVLDYSNKEYVTEMSSASKFDIVNKIKIVDLD